MSDFEEDILSRIATQNEEQVTAIASREKQDVEYERLRVQALKLGSTVVSLLHDRNILTTSIWIKKKIKEVPFTDRPSWKGGTHNGVDHVFRYQGIGGGWTVLDTYTTDEGYSRGDKLALSEDGELLRYWLTETRPNGRLLHGPAVRNAVVSPYRVNPDRSIKILESGLFKDACASLIRTSRPLETKGDLFLQFSSTPLDDTWQSQL